MVRMLLLHNLVVTGQIRRGATVIVVVVVVAYIRVKCGMRVRCLVRVCFALQAAIYHYNEK